jgi:hypothetical protein
VGMVPFYTRFRELAFQEMRSATIQGWEDLPDGDYGFLEFYCNDDNCDCRRVLIQVIAKSDPTKPWATINYGWESEAFYNRRLGNPELAKECTRPTLDPLNPQSKYAPALLRLFGMVVQDTAYVQRLQRHYGLFKEQGKRAVRKDAKAISHKRRRK